MSDLIYPDTLTDIDGVCFFCPLPGDAYDTPYCPYSRYLVLRRKEERARQAGRAWLSAGQVDRMLAESDQHN